VAEIATLLWAVVLLAVIFVGLLAGAFYLGAKAQEKLGILFEINLDKARSKYKALSSLPSEITNSSWAGSPSVDLKGPERTGAEHPAGARPPSPQEINQQRQKAHDWRDTLKTASPKKIS